MAEKGFGVKEINLIGASGTPTIESPNNLNLNAVNVAISTNVSIGGTLNVSGSLSIGGTITYEDVTNIDSVGLITARTGVKVLAGGLNVVGVSYFNNNIVATATTAISLTAADESSDTSCNVLFATAATGNVAPKTGTNLTFNSSNGTLTATSFSGDGSNLSGVAGTPADTDPQVVFDVSASGSSGYIFTGPGNDGSTVDPDIFLIRGQRYRFINTTGSSHPFEFRNSDNSADFTDGITGSQSGTQDFNVQYDAPSHLKYRCTVHSGMIGNIYIRSGADTGASAGTGNLEVDGFLRFDNTVSKILTDTSDGSDDKAILICGGGDTATSRGALAILHGNELNSGRLDLYSGVSGGAMTFNTGTTTTERLRIHSDGKVTINSTAVTNTNDQLTVKRPASSFGEMSMTVDANTTTGTHANAFIFTKSKNTYWNGLGFQSSHGHIGAIVGMRDSTGMNASHKMRIEIGGTGINASEEKTWDFLNTGNLSISDGDLVVASGHGIDFAATSDATGKSNERLEDYEEGTFTPTLSGATTAINMHYTKIGRVVHISGSLAFNSISGSGVMVIGGLPYTSISTLDSYTTLSAHAYDSLNVGNTTYQFQTVRVDQNSTNMRIIIPAGNGNVRTFAQYSHVADSTFRFRVAGFYITA